MLANLDIVYVKIDREQPLKILQSGELFFRVDPEYGPKNDDTSNKILPA